MKNNIEVRHYNRKRERIDILSEENRVKVGKIVAKAVNRAVGR